MSAARTQAPWQPPQGDAQTPDTGLRLYNSLTKTKVPFRPSQGRLVKWYICGPTVYDAAHMGHARAYITFDIVRRVLEDYFAYDVFYQMNVTDIDDKIILRARQNHLFEAYKAKLQTGFTQETHDELARLWEEFVSVKIGAAASESEAAWIAFVGDKTLPQKLQDNAKLKMHYEAAVVMHDQLEETKGKSAQLSSSQIDSLLEASRDIVAPWLDAKDGASVTEHKIFRDLSSHWEAEFMQDMDSLNVRRPDAMTRVSEYVPKIVDYIAKIVQNGYGYESGGSVYFDAKKFDDAEHHHYAKLEPRSAFNAQLVEEGEGAISVGLSEKRAPWDFALWKASRPGEPQWNSPWSKGRPGWHIECSVMASDLFGSQLDIHSGGIDLAFPHHDNEIAQAEAYYDNHQWVNYFLHAGHLHIEGQKMSKSLKNFITIKQAMVNYTARQLRLLFLMHNWAAVLDFKKDSMSEALGVESTFKNFFSTVNALARETRNDIAIGEHNMGADEAALFATILGTQSKVHLAMCDSIDTATVMDHLLKLVAAVNVYVNSRKRHNTALIIKAAKYVQRILTVFGVIETSETIGFEAAASGDVASLINNTVTPLLQTVAEFRDNVRAVVREKRDPKEILALSDKLRDDDLPELGVRLEDREGASSLIKMEDRETLLREKRERHQREADKLKKKAEEKAKVEAKRQEKLLKGKVAPAEMFKQGEHSGQYSAYDAQGIPTHDTAGAELAKKRRKKLEAEFETQIKLHEDYVASLTSSDASVSAP